MMEREDGDPRTPDRPVLGPLPRTLFGYRSDAVRGLADQMEGSDRAHYEAWRESLARTEARLSELRARRMALQARRDGLAETAGFLASNRVGTEATVGYVESALDSQIAVMRQAHEARMRDMERHAQRLEEEIARSQTSLYRMAGHLQTWLEGDAAPDGSLGEGAASRPESGGTEAAVRAFSLTVSLLMGRSGGGPGAYADATPLGNGIVRLPAGPALTVIRTRGDGPVGELDGLAVTPSPIRIVGYLVRMAGEACAIPAADAVSVRAGLLEVRDRYRLLPPALLPLYEPDTSLQVLALPSGPEGSTGAALPPPREPAPVWRDPDPSPGGDGSGHGGQPEPEAVGVIPPLSATGPTSVAVGVLSAPAAEVERTDEGGDPGAPDGEARGTVASEAMAARPSGAEARLPAPFWLLPSVAEAADSAAPGAQPVMPGVEAAEESEPAGNVGAGDLPAAGPDLADPIWDPGEGPQATSGPLTGQGIREGEGVPTSDAVLVFLEGKIVGRDLTDAQGNVLARAGETIDRAVVHRAEAAGRLPELIVYMTLPGVSGV